MHSVSKKCHKCVSERGELGGTTVVQSSMAGLGSPALSLPSLAKVPGVIRQQSNSRRWVSLATSLLEAGYIKDEVSNRPLSEIATEGLGNWLKESFSELTWFNVNFTVSEPEEGWGEIGTECCEELGFNPTSDDIDIHANVTASEVVRLKGGISTLNDACPGLGDAVMYALEYGMPTGLGMRDLSWHLGVAKYIYLCGHETVAQWAYENDVQEEDYDGPSPEELTSQFIQIKHNDFGLSKRKLSQICKSDSATDVVKEVAGLVLQSRGDQASFFHTHVLGDHFDWTEEDPVFSVGLVWEDTGLVDRVQEDCSEMAYNSGGNFVPATGVLRVPVDQPNWFRSQTLRWKPLIKRAKAVERLLTIIAGLGECQEGF